MTALSSPEDDAPFDLSELSIQLYHPDSCPVASTGFMDENGVFDVRMEPMKAYVADDGVLHVVGERRTIRQQIRGLDLGRARVLTRVASIWLRRVRDLTPAISQLLCVRNVWCDTKTDQNSQKFVIWAGYLLEQRCVCGGAYFGQSLSMQEAYNPAVWG